MDIAFGSVWRACAWALWGASTLSSRPGWKLVLKWTSWARATSKLKLKRRKQIRFRRSKIGCLKRREIRIRLPLLQNVQKPSYQSMWNRGNRPPDPGWRLLLLELPRLQSNNVCHQQTGKKKRQGFQRFKRLSCKTVSPYSCAPVSGSKETEEDGGEVLDKESLLAEEIYEQDTLKWNPVELSGRVWLSYVLGFKVVYKGFEDSAVKR